MNQEKLKETQNIKNQLSKNVNKIKYISYTLNGICAITGTCAIGTALCHRTEHAFLLGCISMISYFGAQDTYDAYCNTKKNIKKLNKKIHKIQK